MARRDLLTDSERHALFTVPAAREDLARHYMLSSRDLALVAVRRGDTNRIGFAVQLALMRHPGFGFTLEGGAPDHLVAFMGEQIDVSASAFDTYAVRPATASVHAREVGDALGLRGPTNADLPSPSVIERAGIAGRARARQRTYDALLACVPVESLAKLDATLVVDPKTSLTPLAWLREIATAPTPDNVRGLLDRLARVRDIGLPVTIGDAIHADRLRQFVREGRASSAQLIGRYTPSRRRATLAAMILDLESRLTDAALDMADRIIGGSFTRGNNKQKRSYAETTRDVGRIMRLFDRTVAALAEAQESGMEGFAAVDAAVGWDKLLRARGQARRIADMAEENPLVRAADQWSRLRKFAPLLLEAIDFKAGRGSASTIAALNTLREMNRSGSRDVPPDAPMPFRKEWRTLVKAGGGKPDRRLWETGVLAHLRNKWRSGDVWVERSANYRKFDSYMLSSAEAAPIAADLKLPATADAWIADRSRELDWRLKRFADGLARGEVEGVAFKDGKLSVSPVRADESAAAKDLAARIDALMPHVRITELLHEVARATAFPQAFLNVRTGEHHDNENALLAAILADGSNLGLARMAAASQGVSPDQLIWTKSAYIAPDNYKAALARIINAHHSLPIASAWGQGSTSSSDGQFFRSGKRGSGAGDFNAKYGVDPGFSFYTHVSDQHGPYHVTVISAATHEAPYVLDGLLHHGTGLEIDTHYTDTGGATDHVFALCRMLGFRFSPRLRDLPDRRMACIEAPGQYPSLKPLMGARVKVDVIREHWDEIVRLVASLKAGTVLPSAMLRKLAAYERQNQLDLALREIGRVERTLFMLDWLESPALRRRCQAGLNKSEQRHFLTQAICTFKQGRIADRTHEAQQFRASGLNLVIAAIVYWNSTYIADAVAHLRAIGEPAPDELLAHTSPVGWGHIAFSGDFLWDRAAAMPTGRRPLNLGRMSMAA
ncbi:Tn3 family transposase (plasmid) [Sphingobium sp. SJ10-10]|uniref:Tn3 family transposase n=1 Tax=Sphingobium sp. SJ10-10 TaxID=3114999 RepID=UPI002E174A96|nr:Tn3 family transposase [Sphingobium sp. SJ10-10]